MVKKYIKIYHKRNLQLAFFCASMVFVTSIILIIFDKVSVCPEDIIVLFMPFLLTLPFLFIASLYTIRFKKMIKEQEQLYKIKFNDADAVWLENVLYISKEWLIAAGTCAIYKPHLKSLKSIRHHGKYGTSYRVIFKTINGKKYKTWINSPSDIQRIRKWKKT